MSPGSVILVAKRITAGNNMVVLDKDKSKSRECFRFIMLHNLISHHGLWLPRILDCVSACTARLCVVIAVSIECVDRPRTRLVVESVLISCVCQCPLKC